MRALDDDGDRRHSPMCPGAPAAGLYLAHVLFADWRDLPGRRSGPAAERVWLLGAADRGGWHRTRLLVVGRKWRPRCLHRVNMLSQPVVYAGGGPGVLTADLFLWWFHREFAPTAAAMHPQGALLLAERAEYMPSEEDCIAGNGLIKLLVVPRDGLRGRPVANELRARLAVFLLVGALSEARMTCDADGAAAGLEAYVERFSLKEAFAELHGAWLSVRPETFRRCWRKAEDASAISGEERRGDSVLLSELGRLLVEAGLPGDEEELRSWLLDEESEYARCVLKPDTSSAAEEDGSVSGRDDEQGEKGAPNAREVVGLLSQVLEWMETEPLEPGFLLAARAMRATATSMVSHGRENVSLIDR